MPKPPEEKKHRFRTYSLAIQQISRNFGLHLNSNQFRIAIFIADRTLGWGKTWEVITHKHFMEGIPDMDNPGSYHIAPVCMTRHPLTDALNGMIEMGLILVRKIRCLTSYSLNLLWSASLATQPQNDMGLAKPKRMQTLQTPEPVRIATRLTEDGHDEGWHIPPPLVADPATPHWQIPPPKKSKEKKGKGKKTFLSEKCEAVRDETEEPTFQSPTLDEVLADVSDKSKTARSKRLSKWNNSTSFAIWTDLEKLHHIGVTHFTTTQANRYALTQYGKKWIAANGSVENWLIYLEWCVANWSLIRSEQLAWMRDAPIQPCVPFFVRNSTRFERAHEEKAVFESISQMSLRDREVERRVQKGVIREVAEKEVDERNGLTKERERIEAAASSIKRSNISAAGRVHDNEAAAERNRKWAERAKITAPAEIGTFDEWQ